MARRGSEKGSLGGDQARLKIQRRVDVLICAHSEADPTTRKSVQVVNSGGSQDMLIGERGRETWKKGS